MSKRFLLLGLCFFQLKTALANEAEAPQLTPVADRNAIRRHVFRNGEAFTYNYDDTDITYCGDVKDGIPIAASPLTIQQIKIPVKITVSSNTSGLSRKLSLLPNALVREGNSDSFGMAKFNPIRNAIPAFPTEFSYSYPDESFALSHLFDLFKVAINNTNFMANPIAQLLFFKTQDVHQMQASAMEVREGMTPGMSYLVPAHETPGLGGKFLGGPAQYTYIDVERLHGVRVAQIRATNLGNQFTNDSLTTYTNFTFTMYIALEGTNRGLLMSGTGQETAYPIMVTPNPSCPHPVLQRQFSIQLR